MDAYNQTWLQFVPTIIYLGTNSNHSHCPIAHEVGKRKKKKEKSLTAVIFVTYYTLNIKG